MEPEIDFEITATDVRVAGRSFPLAEVTNPRMTVRHQSRLVPHLLGCMGGFWGLMGVAAAIDLLFDLERLTWSSGTATITFVGIGVFLISLARGWLRGRNSEYHLTVTCAHGECSVVVSEDAERVRRFVYALRDALAARPTAD